MLLADQIGDGRAGYMSVTSKTEGKGMLWAAILQVVLPYKALFTVLTSNNYCKQPQKDEATVKSLLLRHSSLLEVRNAVSDMATCYSCVSLSATSVVPECLYIPCCTAYQYPPTDAFPMTQSGNLMQVRTPSGQTPLILTAAVGGTPTAD